MHNQTTPKQILIIDDNVINLKVAMAELETRGLEIIIARNGETGLERAAFAQPDLILLDVQMPGINGFETCRQLKANEATRDIPVIFMTALTDVADKVRGFESGGVDYVTKPIQVDEVWARVQTHLTIRELQLEREERIAELDAFAHTVAHDLKNPLSRIILSQELLQEKLEPLMDDKSKAIMNISVNGGRHLVKIIDELLLLASVRQGDIETEPVDMAAVVLSTQDRLAHMIDEAHAEIILPESWPTAMGYAPWLEEVWANYLSNGLKYGGQPPRLHLGSVDQLDGMVRFWIQDNGAGLTTDEQDNLFKAFSRVHDQSIKGHGLGLSIVGRIVKRLGGEAGVESEVGKGSRFYFTLPISNETQLVGSSEPSASIDVKRPFPTSILIADDNKTNVLDAKAIHNLRKTVGNDPISLALLIDSFMEDVMKQLTNLQNATADQDAKGMYMAAHSLKSLGSNFGATQFASISRDIELAAQAGDTTSAQANIPILMQAVEPLVTALSKLKDE